VAVQISQRRRVASLPSEGLTPDSYLTDGTRLWRVVSRFGADAATMFASLEDCSTLEVRPYSSGEIDAMTLRMVQAPAGD